MVRKILLICGILSPVLYAISDAVAGMQWKGYSFRNQTISELGAIGAPSRPLFAVLLLIVYGLTVAFGVGILKSSAHNSRLRIVGGLFVALGVMALTIGQFASMRLRGTAQGFAGALHLVEGAVAMLMIFTAMGIAASAFGTRFRLYTIATIMLALGFGAWAGSAAPRIEQGLGTPWVGVIERVFWYGYQSWFIVLAVTLLRGHRVPGSRYAFKTPEGEAAYIAAYDAAMRLWPVPYEERQIATRFGMTHVVVSGPSEAPPLVLLHGYMATAAMWRPNIADFSREYRVYVIDIMGQPAKSIPEEPIRNAADYSEWLSVILNKLQLDRICLMGMSYGGWLALNFAVAKPERIQKLVLLSPGGVLPLRKQFSLRGMLMVSFPAHATVNSFMGWLGITDRPNHADARPILELIYLGVKHFRIPQETLRVLPTALSDQELQALNMPVLLLIGEDEVLYDAAKALARASTLIRNFEGALIPGCRHDMCFSQYRIVDGRALEFLRKTGTGSQGKTTQQSVA